jgi:hypothetical protein
MSNSTTKVTKRNNFVVKTSAVGGSSMLKSLAYRAAYVTGIYLTLAGNTNTFSLVALMGASIFSGKFLSNKTPS